MNEDDLTIDDGRCGLPLEPDPITKAQEALERIWDAAYPDGLRQDFDLVNETLESAREKKGKG